MMKNILVCTDGSPSSQIAIDYACHLAVRIAGQLRALHVLDSRVLEGPLMADISNWVGAQPYGAQVHLFVKMLEEKGRAILDAARARCAEAGVSVETMMKTGHPVRVIAEAEARAELLVLGRRGEHAEWTDGLAGSSVERIVRRSSRPCLVTPEQFAPVTRILAAFDGSGHAAKALTEAAELARALGTELLLVVAADAMALPDAERLAAEAAVLLRPHPVRAKTLVREGRAASVILAVAAEAACDLIVMGAYGHTRIRDMILGSNTNEVMMRAPCPLLLVR